MQSCRELRGIIPVVQTPVHEDGKVDIEGLTRLIEFLLRKDVGGFWALGTGSEDMNLSFEKRLIVARTIAAANAGRKPLILGAGFFATDDVLAFMAATKDLQFDAYHVMPYHPLLGLDGMEKFYRDLAARAPKPLWMYTSANWCRAFPPDFVAQLKACPNIAGIKFSTSRTTDQINVIAMAEPGFQVITAVATQFFVVLSLGVAASTTSLAGALPEPLIEIYTLYRSGRREEALAAQHKMNAFLRRLPSRPKAWNFLGAAEEKYILSLRGICEPYVTSYYTSLTEEERAQVRAALEESGYAALLQEPVDGAGAA
jgi:dihydrodipicolinate synthase/N-acetylneuraminate lyase